MSIVLLIHGSGGSGKSTLANWLSDGTTPDRCWHHTCLDRAYVAFVEEQCPELYFPWMNLFILDHYQRLVVEHQNYLRSHTQRDVREEWHAHLRKLSLDAAAQHEKVAIVGWILFDRREELKAVLGAAGHKVHGVFVEKHGESPSYRVAGVYKTQEQIAALA